MIAQCSEALNPTGDLYEKSSKLRAEGYITDELICIILLPSLYSGVLKLLPYESTTCKFPSRVAGIARRLPASLQMTEVLFLVSNEHWHHCFSLLHCVLFLAVRKCLNVEQYCSCDLIFHVWELFSPSLPW